LRGVGVIKGFEIELIGEFCKVIDEEAIEADLLFELESFVDFGGRAHETCICL
jgi:hypothetical protein